MPKMKSNSSAKKRFKLTGSGKVKRSCANHNHRFDGKSKGSKLRNRDPRLVHESDTPRILRLLCC